MTMAQPYVFHVSFLQYKYVEFHVSKNIIPSHDDEKRAPAAGASCRATPPPSSLVPAIRTTLTRPLSNPLS